MLRGQDETYKKSKVRESIQERLKLLQLQVSMSEEDGGGSRSVVQRVAQEAPPAIGAGRGRAARNKKIMARGNFKEAGTPMPHLMFEMGLYEVPTVDEVVNSVLNNYNGLELLHFLLSTRSTSSHYCSKKERVHHFNTMRASSSS